MQHRYDNAFVLQTDELTLKARFDEWLYYQMKIYIIKYFFFKIRRVFSEAYRIYRWRVQRTNKHALFVRQCLYDLANTFNLIDLTEYQYYKNLCSNLTQFIYRIVADTVCQPHLLQWIKPIME